MQKCPVAQKMIQQLIFSCAVLIGSGWERSFDVAIETVVKNVVPDERRLFSSVFVKMALSIVLTLIVLPAWRWYIVPTILELEEAEEEEEEIEVGRRTTVKSTASGSPTGSNNVAKLDALEIGRNDLNQPLIAANGGS